MRTGTESELLNLIVWVCEDCNSQWMSGLETEAKAVLRPFILDGETKRLSADDLRILTTWATKSWMAYALTLPVQQNPFTETEYRAMADSAAPLGRCRVGSCTRGSRVHTSRWGSIPLCSRLSARPT